MNKKKLLQKVLSGTRNLRFEEARVLVEAFGFRLQRVSGSHHIFVHPDVDKLVNLQEVGGQAKLYQIKQLLRIVEQYRLQLDQGDDDE
ncbi:MAG: type II toxin-antitoxin system HicA family toxin [Deltaproteobacteria bacterium]|nr:type II toxin-antitoxin system HicA family toxin [Deltaproteobacteria bacterium]